jgi:putative nucleotidyltransferase with HDIG domain
MSMLQFIETLGQELSNGDLQLPSFPDAVLNIRKLLSDPNTTISKVAQAVRSEPVFAARLFKMANSVLLRRSDTPLTDLHTVIARLGFDMIRNLAIALATRQIMTSKKYGGLRDDLHRIWERSVQSAAIAYVLARDSRCADPDDALLAGLLHDIGVFYILSRTADYPELFEDRDAIDVAISDWHAAIGHAILEAWDFPARIAQAVNEHENRDRVHESEHPDLTDVLIVASALAHRHNAAHQDPALGDIPAFARFNISTETSIARLNESKDEIQALIIALH